LALLKYFSQSFSYLFPLSTLSFLLSNFDPVGTLEEHPPMVNTITKNNKCAHPEENTADLNKSKPVPTVDKNIFFI
jgi:hypothetical protein